MPKFKIRCEWCSGEEFHQEEDIEKGLLKMVCDECKAVYASELLPLGNMSGASFYLDHSNLD